jgi:dolichol-phosphate mannosyltransferase
MDVDSNVMTISVVSTTLNECEDVPRLIGELEHVLSAFDYEIIVADDDSPDTTWAIAEDIVRRQPGVRVLRRRPERRLGWSVIDDLHSIK